MHSVLQQNSDDSDHEHVVNQIHQYHIDDVLHLADEDINVIKDKTHDMKLQSGIYNLRFTVDTDSFENIISL